MTFQIVGIRKPGGANNPHEAISHYQWIDDGETAAYITERLKVISWVEDLKLPAYVLDGSRKIWCQVRQNENGTKYLQTVADGQWSNNLLALPEV